MQLDERAERRDERVARDRAARLGVDPRLVPDRLGVVEAVGERIGVDGEDVGGVVLGVERPGGESLLGTRDACSHGASFLASSYERMALITREPTSSPRPIASIRSICIFAIG